MRILYIHNCAECRHQAVSDADYPCNTCHSNEELGLEDFFQVFPKEEEVDGK